VILAARPSLGKTSLALNVARNAAVGQNATVAFFSLETAGEQGCVGLARNDQPLSEVVFSAALRHGEVLLPAVEAALRLAEARQSDLGLISVSVGPGSFTGLRIGIATAKGLARALGIPVVGVRAFEPYVQTVGFWEGPVWVLLPDRRDWVYCAGFRGGEQTAPPQALSLEVLLQLGDLKDGKEEERPLFIGPGAECHREQLTRGFPQGVVAPTVLNRPSWFGIARLGRESYLIHGHDQLYELEPLYLQPPLAEATAQKRDPQTTKPK
jgi:tRNA threonylcarbamoyladenosine biosynthesis protein TsaB